MIYKGNIDQPENSINSNFIHHTDHLLNTKRDSQEKRGNTLRAFLWLALALLSLVISPSGKGIDLFYLNFPIFKIVICLLALSAAIYCEFGLLTKVRKRK